MTARKRMLRRPGIVREPRLFFMAHLLRGSTQELQKPPAQTANVYISVQPRRQLVVPIPSWPANEPAPALPIPAWNLNNPASRLVQVSSSLQPAQTGRAYSWSGSSGGPSISGKFGGLAVTLTGIVLSPNQSQSDRARLAAFVTVACAGTGFVCATLTAALHTSFDLTYEGSSAPCHEYAK